MCSWICKSGGQCRGQGWRETCRFVCRSELKPYDEMRSLQEWLRLEGKLCALGHSNFKRLRKWGGTELKRATGTETQGDQEMWCRGSSVRKVIWGEGCQQWGSVLLTRQVRWGLRIDHWIQLCGSLVTFTRAILMEWWLQKTDWSVFKREWWGKNRRWGGQENFEEFCHEKQQWNDL